MRGGIAVCGSRWPREWPETVILQKILKVVLCLFQLFVGEQLGLGGRFLPILARLLPSEGGRVMRRTIIRNSRGFRAGLLPKWFLGKIANRKKKGCNQ